MRLTELRIRNYKSISDLLITDIENALILVGKNNTGKTAILDAIRVVTGSCAVEMGAPRCRSNQHLPPI